MTIERKRIKTMLAATLVAVTVIGVVDTEAIAQTSSIYAMPQAAGGLTLDDLSLTTIEVTPPREIQQYDTITIIVDEKSQLLSEGEMLRRKQADILAVIEDWVRFRDFDLKPSKQLDGDQTIGLDLESQYRAIAEMETRDGLKFRIAATVVDIRPNGYLVLEAHKTIKNNEEHWEQRLTGLVNPEDILPNRSVLSEKITELNITKCEQGHVRDGYRRGWLLRFLDKVQPF